VARARSDDEIFKSAKTKLGRVIDKTDDPEKLCDLVNALVKMKEVEIKANDTGYGGSLRDPSGPEPPEE
jgi:hypothetical protein